MKDANAKSVVKEKKRESPAGYHYYFSYLDNPRNFYLKYVLGLKPRWTAPPLIKGGAMHEAREKFLRTFNVQEMLDTYSEEMTSRMDEYEDKGQGKADLEQGLAMLSQWAFDLGKVYAEDYEILEIEQEHTLYIGPEQRYRHTVRPDTVVKDKKTGVVSVVDMKTTGWSAHKAVQQAAGEDQITSYIWAMEKEKPELKCRQAIIDVLYSRKNKNGFSPTEVYLSDPIRRTQLDLKIYELTIVGLIMEITQKVMATKNGVPWPLLFPRNGRISGLFDDPYKDIARLDIKPGDVPPGFVADDWASDMDEFINQVPLEDYKIFDTGGKDEK